WADLRRRNRAEGRAPYAPWNEFERFLTDVGLRPGPGYQLRRLDLNRRSEPGNVHWTTEQQRGHRIRVPVKLGSTVVSVAQAARLVGLPTSVLAYRIRH